MKIYAFLALLFISCSNNEIVVENNPNPPESTNGVWTTLGDVPSAVKRYEAINFVINGFLYVGLGSNLHYDTVNSPAVYEGGYSNGIWKYDINANSWTQMADFPGEPRCGAVSFSLNNKGYVGLGYVVSNGTQITKKDFWEYDPLTDNWTQLSDFPGASRKGSVCYSINNMGYLGLGDSNGTYYNDFWKFDPTTNSWTQLTNYPGSSRTNAVGFEINGNLYAGLGGTISVNYDDFWKYNVSNDTWVQISSCISNDKINGRTNMSGFSIGSNGYIIGGNNRNANSPFIKDTHSFSKYNSTNDTWTVVSPAVNGTCRSMISFTYNNRVFMGLGYTESTYIHDDMNYLGTSLYEYVY